MAADLNPLRRRLMQAAVVGGVLVLHLMAADWVGRHLSRGTAEPHMPARIQVSYVREMELTPPPERVAPPPPPRRQVPVARAVVQAASAAPPPAPDDTPLPDTSEPDTPEPGTPATETPLPPLAAAAEASAPEQPVVAAQASEAASSPDPEAKPFEWPLSTRLRYDLLGDFRGEVRGEAQVEWIVVGDRYQVHLDVSVALLASRRMSSDGRITPEGLAPQRYDQETSIALREPTRSTVRFEGDSVWLANGRQAQRPPGVQDTVSQFVQMSWLFATQPERLRAGERIELPLAMPRNVSVWAYEVQGEEFLTTPFGEIQAFHLKPLRGPRAGGDMTVDIWVAPQLRYLPVRFRIRPDPEAYFDLMLDRRPELAARQGS